MAAVMSDSQLGQSRITAGSLAASLAVGNTMAYIGTYFAETALIKDEFATTKVDAQWGLVLNLVGVPLGVFLWPEASNKYGTRNSIIFSCLLLAICSSLTNTLWSFPGILLLRLASGVLGSAPLYLYDVIYTDNFGCLRGLNLGLITFALTGGLAWGIVIRLVAEEWYGIFFTYSSSLCAISLFLSLENSSPILDEELPREECDPPKTPLVNAMDSLAGVMGTESTCYSCYFYVLYYLVIPSRLYYGFHDTIDRMLPLCGVILGSGYASVNSFMNIPPVYPKDSITDPERFKEYDYAGLVTAGIALEVMVWLLRDIYHGGFRQYFIYVLFFAGIMLGVAIVEIFSKPIALKADCYARYPKGDYHQKTAIKYSFVAFWTALACGVTNRGGGLYVVIVMHILVPQLAQILYVSWSRAGQLVIACVEVPGMSVSDADGSAGPTSSDPSSCDPNSGNDIRMQDLERENQELRAKLNRLELEASS